VTTEKVYWFAVDIARTTRVSELDVERFDTLEQAQFYAAATGWRVPFAGSPNGSYLNSPSLRVFYNAELRGRPLADGPA
jgi:hypothetical protein